MDSQSKKRTRTKQAEKIMKAVLNQEDYLTFLKKVDTLREKDYKLEFDYDLIDSMYHVMIKGEHDIAELDRLTE